ncbi:uncharacterized protein LOC129600529 [Paramacrobiotus metropolitanus]|uniref:uncharacterized protein LOC129600529 n=1 Tax=Paramacrobiotus metropolitanus TaxID=2943436 RepID=UPI002445C5C7|nr:uncharacterized protein LOC129600529 [Paramacrobiotus metropolitanus]
MLKYIYADNEKVTLENVHPTMKCADKYDLSLLADTCFDFVIRDLVAEDRLTVDSPHCLLHLENALACAVGIDRVVENCLHYVDVHCEEVLRSKRFTELPPGTLRAILERDTLLADEDIIFTAVNRWAAAACARRNLEASPANRREVLGELFYLIRFPLLTPISQVPDKPAKSGFFEALSLLDVCHDKGRFPTQPRRPPVILVGEVEFKHAEQVFVADSDETLYVPALVMGSRGSAALCLPLNYFNVRPHPDDYDYDSEDDEYHDDNKDDDYDGDADDDYDENEDLMKVDPGDIIRASDYLTARQPVWYNHEKAKYVKAEDCRHIIALPGRPKREVAFDKIYLGHLQVMAWKKATEIGNGKAQAARKRKRSPDALVCLEPIVLVPSVLFVFN